MTPEAQRIAIAEACGWTRPCDMVAGTELARKWFPTGLSMTTDSNDLRYLPNYLTDLNAMHEAEKVLTVGQRIEYARDLGFIFTGRNDRAIPDWWFIHEATAPQRAEAFLRTLNLWDDSK